MFRPACFGGTVKRGSPTRAKPPQGGAGLGRPGSPPQPRGRGGGGDAQSARSRWARRARRDWGRCRKDARECTPAQGTILGGQVTTCLIGPPSLASSPAAGGRWRPATVRAAAGDRRQLSRLRRATMQYASGASGAPAPKRKEAEHARIDRPRMETTAGAADGTRQGKGPESVGW